MKREKTGFHFAWQENQKNYSIQASRRPSLIIELIITKCFQIRLWCQLNYVKYSQCALPSTQNYHPTVFRIVCRLKILLLMEIWKMCSLQRKLHHKVDEAKVEEASFFLRKVFATVFISRKIFQTNDSKVMIIFAIRCRIQCIKLNTEFVLIRTSPVENLNVFIEAEIANIECLWQRIWIELHK